MTAAGSRYAGVMSEISPRTPAGIVVLTGAPGVGKSTVARELAGLRPRCAHVKADDLHRMIVSGGQWPSAGTSEAGRQLQLRTRHAGILAASFADAGFSVVIDEVLATSGQVDTLAAQLSARAVVIVGLAADTDTIRKRDASRHKHTAVLYDGIERSIRAVVPGPWVDTRCLTVPETVAAVCAIAGW